MRPLLHWGAGPAAQGSNWREHWAEGPQRPGWCCGPCVLLPGPWFQAVGFLGVAELPLAGSFAVSVEMSTGERCQDSGGGRHPSIAP